MKLGLNIGYWGMPGGPTDIVALAREAEALGYVAVWAAEAYGSDAVSVLSALACQTTSIDIGSAVMQIPARTPTMTAMTTATLDSSAAVASGSVSACPDLRSPKGGTACGSRVR